MKKTVVFVSLIFSIMSSYAQTSKMEWISTTESNPWVVNKSLQATKNTNKQDYNIIIDPSKSYQVIDGFGTCFNELGWTSLNQLDAKKRESIMKEMFSPGVGANFTICRMPIAANDFAIDWYSYDETDGDFDLKNFSIDHDKKR